MAAFRALHRQRDGVGADLERAPPVGALLSEKLRGEAWHRDALQARTMPSSA